MANVTAAMVKELRDITGAGMMDCKKALVATDGNIEAAIEEMRKSGALKAAKKATRTAAEGTIAAAQEGNVCVLVEVNSETDFAAKNAEFQEFASKVADVAMKSGATDVETLKAQAFDGSTVGEALTALVAKIGENLNVRRVTRVEGENLGLYVHSNRRIGVIVSLKGGDEELAKHVAMHVCASKPDFVHPEDVSAEVVEKERQIQIDIAVQSGKPQEIAEKMVAGRMKKFTGEVSLTGQPFVMDPSMSVGDLLKSKNADAISFVRFEVGEGIEKKESNFAEEVQAQIAASSK